MKVAISVRDHLKEQKNVFFSMCSKILAESNLVTCIMLEII